MAVRTSAPPATIDGRFDLWEFGFKSGTQAAIALGISDVEGRIELCAAFGYDGQRETLFGDELIERWMRLRKVSLGDRLLVSDLSFAAKYETPDLPGRVANCVITNEPYLAGDADLSTTIDGPSRVEGRF